MAANQLKLITARAKQIRKAKPGMKWTNAIKQAGREISSKKSGSRGKPAKKKQPRKSPVKAVKRKSMPAPKKRGKRTAAQLTKAAQKLLLQEIGDAYARKFIAPTKTKRKKIQKALSQKQSQYNRLSK